MKNYLSRAPIRIMAFAVIIAMLAGLLPAIPREASAATMPGNPRLGDNNVTWDCVWFGYYPQTSNGSGGHNNDPIKWRVLSVNEEGEALLLADQNLDAKPYNETDTSVTWETSTIRSWLNGYRSGSNKDGKDYTGDNFINKAFPTAEERDAIKGKTIQNPDNPEYGTAGGNSTTDKIFLLSIDEVTKPAYGFPNDYDEDSKTRRALNTDYAKHQGAWTETDPSSEYVGNGWWKLRSPGYNSHDAASVNAIGGVYRRGSNVSYDDNAIRPALFLNLKSNLWLWSYAGTVSSEGKVEETEGGSHIVSLIPESGHQYAELTTLPCLIEFDQEIKLTGNGCAYLKEYGTDHVVEKVELKDEASSCRISMNKDGKLVTLILRFNANGSQLSKDTKYYVSIDADAVEPWDYDRDCRLGGKFSGIDDKKFWNFKTSPVEYSKLTNPSVSQEIDISLYKKLYGPLSAERIKKKDDGTQGICFGLSYATGAWKSQFNGISAIGSGGGSMMGLEQSTKGESAYTFLRYLQMAHIYQFKSKYVMERMVNNNASKLYKAISEGKSLIIGVHKDAKTGHALFPMGIMSEDDETVKIAVYDCDGHVSELYGGESALIRPLTLKKKDGSVTDWEYGSYGGHSTSYLNFNYIDPSLDNIVSKGTVEKESANMVYSSTKLLDDALTEITGMGSTEGTERKDAEEPYLYWTNDTAVTRDALDSEEPAELGITDGYKEVSVSAPLNAKVAADLNANKAKIQFNKSLNKQDYVITYRQTDDADNFETYTISGNASNQVTMEKTVEGIDIRSDNLKNTSVQYETPTTTKNVTINSDQDHVLIKKAGDTLIKVEGDKGNDDSSGSSSPSADVTTKSKPTTAKNTKPKKVTLSKVKSTKRGALKLTWKRDKKVIGYQAVVATDKKFKKNKKTALITKNKTVTKTFTKLKRKKTYFAKVRAYKKSGKTKVYGAYSKVKKAKVK